MATVKRFEELEIWQLARMQCQQFVGLAEGGVFKADFALKDQMDRSSGSVMDNIAEGFDRFSRQEFRQFLVIAGGSNAEYRSQLYRAGDKKLISENRLQAFLKSSVNLSVKVSNLISHLHNSSYKSKQPSGSPGNISEPESIYLSSPELSYDLPTHFISETTTPH